MAGCNFYPALTRLMECLESVKVLSQNGSQIFNNAISPFVVDPSMDQNHRQDGAPVPVETSSCTRPI